MGGVTNVNNLTVEIVGGIWTMDPKQAKDFFRVNERYIREALER